MNAEDFRICSNLLRITRKSVPSDFRSLQLAAGHGDGPWHRAYDGKPPPAALQGPDYITYAGLTLPKAKKDVDYWYSKVLGSLVW